MSELSQTEREVKLYTTGEVALLCAVTPETVRNWINSGELEGIRVNNYWRVRHKSLVKFLDDRHGKVTPDV